MPAYVNIKVDTAIEPAGVMVLNGVPTISFGKQHAYIELVGKTIEEVQIIAAMFNAAPCAELIVSGDDE